MHKFFNKSPLYKRLEECNPTPITEWTTEARKISDKHKEITTAVEIIEETINGKHKHYSLEDQDETNDELKCATCLIPRLWCSFCETLHKPVHEDEYKTLCKEQALCNKCSITIKLFQRCPHKLVPTLNAKTTTKGKPKPPLKYGRVRSMLKNLNPFKRKEPPTQTEIEMITKEIPAAATSLRIKANMRNRHSTYIRMEDIINPDSECHTGTCLACEFGLVWCKRCENLHITLAETMAPEIYSSPNTCNICRIHMDAFSNCPEYSQNVYREAREKRAGLHIELPPIMNEEDNYYFKLLKENILDQAYTELQRYPLKRKLYIEMIEIYDAYRKEKYQKQREGFKWSGQRASTLCEFCEIPIKWCVKCKKIHKNNDCPEAHKKQETKVCTQCEDYTTKAKACKRSPLWTETREDKHLPMLEVITSKGFNTIPNFTDEQCRPQRLEENTQRMLIEALPVRCQAFDCLHLTEAIRQSMSFDITLATIVNNTAKAHRVTNATPVHQIAYYNYLKQALDRENITDQS